MSEVFLIVIVILPFLINTIWLIITSGNNKERDRRIEYLENHLNIKGQSRLCEIEYQLRNLPQSKAKVAQKKIDEAREIIDSIGE